MQVRMTARHFDLTDDLRRHVENRSGQFTRFFDHIIDLHWVLETDKRQHVAETSAQVHGTTLTGRGVAEDMRTAVDEAAGKMEAQLKKYKARLKDRDQRAIADAKGAAQTRPEQVSGDGQG